MAISENDLTKIIKEAFPNAKFLVKDLVGDEDHWMLEIEDKIFEGKTRIEQHKLVNQALKDYVGTIIHALTIKIKNF